jgi:exodeoxyribonuclease V beta subunit
MSLNLLTLPLSGRQIIEASAGTGKTFTLAALYVRLVLGHGRAAKGLQPAHILVMTFTDAATAELRERIRLRLHQAALWFDAEVAGRNCKPDPFLN